MSVQQRSSSSVVIKYTNLDRIRKAVTNYFTGLRRQHSEIERGIWFGSWVTGFPHPGSDVDLCLILSSSDKAFRDRIPAYLPRSFPVGLDLFPYTQQEFAGLKIDSPAWYACIDKGIALVD